MPPQGVIDAIKEHMPNFNIWVNSANLTESEVMDKLESLLGVWLKKPTGMTYTANESLIYTKTLITLIADRGYPQDLLMKNRLVGYSRLLGDRDTDKDHIGIVDWESREVYSASNAVTIDRVTEGMAGTYLGPHDKIPDDALPGMTYCNTGTGLMFVYDGNDWVEIVR